MTDLPAPPVPADCDLRDMDGFMLNAERLLASELWALSDGTSFKAAVALWCRAWKQIPAASLPDDDAVIAAFAGVSVPMLRKNRAIILRGFIKCSDGRLYHKTLAEDAARSMAAKQRRKEAKEAEAERLRTYRERKKNAEQNGERTGERTPYEQSTYGTRQDRTGQGQDRDRTGLTVLEAADAASRGANPAAAAASPEQGITDQPREIRVIQARTFGDFQAMHGRVYVPGQERDAWNAVFTEYGWDPLDDAYRTLDAETPPGKRILLSRVLDWLTKNYRKAGGGA